MFRSEEGPDYYTVLLLGILMVVSLEFAASSVVSGLDGEFQSASLPGIDGAGGPLSPGDTTQPTRLHTSKYGTPEFSDGVDEYGVNCNLICQKVEANHGLGAQECSQSCREQQCLLGCRNWRVAANSSCQQVCERRQSWHEDDRAGLYCAVSCAYAAEGYTAAAKALIGTPSEPLLVGDSLSNSTVGLRWTAWDPNNATSWRHFPQNPSRDLTSTTLPGRSAVPTMKLLPVTYLIQSRTQGRDWEYHKDTGRLHDNTVLLTGLMPYTKYQFRVSWLLLPQQAPLHSLPSAWISTLPYGPPQSPPEEAKAVPLDGSRVEVSWRAPRYPAGELVSYTLYMTELSSGEQLRKDVAISENKFVLSGLASNSTLEVQVTAVNRAGEGPAALLTVSTFPSSDEGGRGGYLLLASGASLLRLELDIMKPPTYLYNTSNNQEITGLALHIRLGLLYVSDSSGDILQLRPATQQRRILRLADKLRGGVPTVLSVDWLNGYLYILEDPLKGRIEERRGEGLTMRRQRRDFSEVEDMFHVGKDGSLAFQDVGPLQESSFPSKMMTNFEDFQERSAPKNWHIWRQNLMGENLELVYGNLDYEPKHMQVDPYNGYLWWVRSGHGGGLLRLVVGAFEAAQDSANPEMILQGADLGGFVPDPSNFRVMVANRSNNSMMTVSLDGSLASDARPNTQQAYFEEAEEVVLLHRRFYWTGAKEVYTEELNDGTYYHNSYAMISSQTGPLVGVEPSVQPLPAPLTPPRLLQVLFTSTAASIMWDAPATPPLMGEGAWQSWVYEVHIQYGQRLIYHQNISTTRYHATNLRPGTSYDVKVRAYSKSGEGPWSASFTGSTLELYPQQPRLVLVSDDGLLSSDMAGSNVTLIASKQFLQDHLGAEDFTDMTFFRDLLVLCSLQSGARTLNLTSRQVDVLPGTEGVTSVSVDWLTKRVFWANPHLHLIGWSSLTSGQNGNLGLMTGAVELEVDALRGRLFWATRHAVFAATLLGTNRSMVYQEDLFSGRQVFGMALDAVSGTLWWGVRDPEGDQLFTAHTEGEVIPPRVQSTRQLQHKLYVGPIAYLSGRLLFVGQHGEVVITDTALHSTATLPWRRHHSTDNSSTVAHSTLVMPQNELRVQCALVLLPQLQPLPDVEAEVFPTAVDATTLRCEGTWDNFTLVWAPVSNVNYGSVVYELSVEVLDADTGMGEIERPVNRRFILSSEVNRVRIPWNPSRPYQPFRLNIRGTTRWGSGPKTVSLLRTPSSTPGPPGDLRHFVVKSRDRSDTASSAHLRWRPPAAPNGVIEKYELEICSVGTPGHCDRYTLNGTTLEYVLQQQDLQDITFKVAAATSVGFGSFSSPRAIAAAGHRPVPTLAVATPTTLQVLDADLNSKSALWVQEPASFGLSLGALLSNSSIFFIEDRRQITVLDMKANSTKKISDLRQEGLALDVDWVSERVLWLEESPASTMFLPHHLVSGRSTHPSLDHYRPVDHDERVEKHFPPQQTLSLHALDVNFGSREQLATLQVQGVVTDMLVAPLSDIIFIVERTRDNFRIYSLTNSTEFKEVFSNANRSSNSSDCNCHSAPRLSGGVAYDSSRAELLFGTRGSGGVGAGVVASDNDGCRCTMLVTMGILGDGGCSSLAVDSTHIYCYVSATEDLLWFPRLSVDAGAEGSATPFLRVLRLEGPSIALHALDSALQPMPEIECLTPSNPAGLLVESVGANSAALHITPPLQLAQDSCFQLAPLGYQYTLHYRPAGSSEGSCNHDLNNCSVKVASSRFVTLAGLSSFTSFEVQVSVITVHGARRQSAPLFGPMIPFTTRAEAPPAAGNLTVRGISPETVEVSFMSPKDLPYKIFWQVNSTIEGVSRFPASQMTEVHHAEGALTTVTTQVDKMAPDTKYMVWVRLLSSQDPSVFADSAPVETLTLPPLPPVRLGNATARSLSVTWTAPADGSIKRHAVEHLIPSSDLGIEPTWFEKQFELTESGRRYEYLIPDLLSGRYYIFRVRVMYSSKGNHQYTWPPGPLFNFTTLSDAPSPPGKVRLQQVGGSGEGWEAWWGAADPHGSPIIAYTLEAAPLPTKDQQIQYNSLYNGSANQWPVSGLDMSTAYVFRVQAINEVGPGPWSIVSTLEAVSGPTMLSDINLPTILAATIPASMLFLLLVLSLIACALRKAYQGNSKVKAVNLSSSITHTSRELELATLQQMPNNNNFVAENNILYNWQNFSGEEIDLPRVSQHSITRTKFLGRGEFGEVFEGTASGIAGLPTGGKVAIKMLRKGSTGAEKREFLKEAQLMSHFQHDHILRLLAICADADPFFLVLELMEAGDLLSYLRANRRANTGQGFDLEDLTAMSVDVAKGCQYLEEMHFVHRDLAARNCLVSSTDPATRIVKIGDFGLARDIYKNDYYRKEGEGVLPVRWVSPESLIDGVFTTHSDVWAFGVLLWEIMTMGQQPYPARTNQEVMHYVRTGGRLTLPQNCPLQVEDLMGKCWVYNPEERPSFRECLLVLSSLQRDLLDRPRTLAVHNVNYVGEHGVNGLDNLAYSSEREENFSSHNGPSYIFGIDRQSHRCQGFRNSLDSPNAGTEDTSFDMHEDCTSGASTVPLNAPLRSGQHYFQLVNEPESLMSPQTPTLESLLMSDSSQQSPTSENSTDMSMLSTISTYCPVMSLPSTSTRTIGSMRRKSSPTAESKFTFNSPVTSNRSPTTTLCSRHTPSPFVVSLLNGFLEPDFSRSNSLRLQPRTSASTIPDSPTSVSFKFQLPNLNHRHYVSPASNKSCPNSTSSPISPPTTPEFSNSNRKNQPCAEAGNLEDLFQSNCSYVNQSLLTEDCYTPPESTKSTPENANSLTHDGSLRPRRSSSFDSISRTDNQSNRYINMSPNKGNSCEPSTTSNLVTGGREEGPKGTALGHHQLSLSDLGRSEGSINRLGYESMSIHKETLRLSGVSDLSGMSGMTAGSTLDLDFPISHSNC